MQITRGALEESLKIYAPLYLVRSISSSLGEFSVEDGPGSVVVLPSGLGNSFCVGFSFGGTRRFFGRGGMVEVERGGNLTCYIGREKGEGNLRLSCQLNACG